MQALVNYYRKYESVTPNFTATIRIGHPGSAARDVQGAIDDGLRERSTRWHSSPRVRQWHELTVASDGEGTAFYVARLTYAPDTPR